MADVRSRSGRPNIGDFATGKGTPIVVNDENGQCYVLVGNTITAIGDRGLYNILDYEDGADWGTALQAAVTAAGQAGGGEVIIPPRSTPYTCASGVNILYNRVSIRAYDGAVLSKEFNGDLFTLANGTLYNKFLNLFVDANGDTYTGVVLKLADCQITTVKDWTVVDGADTIISIAPNAASVSWIRDSVFTIHSTHVAAGAVVKNSGPDTQACPRFWINNFGLSSTWFYRGDGLQTFYAGDIYSNGFDFTGGNTDACTIRNCRMALFPQASNAATFRGENMIITNCHFGGPITVASDFDNGLFVDNVQDTSYTFTNNAPLTSMVIPPRTPFWHVGIKTIDTAQLPAASADMNNAIIFENAGVGDRNIIEYANSQRFRVDGGSAV